MDLWERVGETTTGVFRAFGAENMGMANTQVGKSLADEPSGLCENTNLKKRKKKKRGIRVLGF